MSITLEEFGRFEYLLFNVMQASIVVPMVVVWARRRFFSAPVRLLSWYVYLSLFSVVGARFFLIGTPPNNHWYLIAFNCGKIALFAAVYYQVLRQPNARRLVFSVTAATLPLLLLASLYDTQLGISVSRVAHCALLAGFALLYFDQFASRTTTLPLSKDSLWLVSMGQILYSAVTVSFFSYGYFATGQSVWLYIFMDVGGLIFNYFLTLAFLRARSTELGASTSESQSVNMLLKQ